VKEKLQHLWSRPFAGRDEGRKSMRRVSSKRMGTFLGHLYPALIPLVFGAIFVIVSPLPSNALRSGSYHNRDLPHIRPTFVLNFEMGTLICQHSAESQDLHMHELSALCDGKRDCYDSTAMHDEMFPYCGSYGAQL